LSFSHVKFLQLVSLAFPYTSLVIRLGYCHLYLSRNTDPRGTFRSPAHATDTDIHAFLCSY